MGTYMDSSSGEYRNYENKVVQLLREIAEGYQDPESSAAAATEAAEAAAAAAEAAAAAAEALESVVLYTEQELNATEQAQARTNIGAVSTADAAASAVLMTDLDSRVNVLDNLVDYGYGTAYTHSTSGTEDTTRNGTRLWLNRTFDSGTSYFIKLNGTVQQSASQGTSGLSGFTPIKLAIGHRYRWEMRRVSGTLADGEDTANESLAALRVYTAGTSTPVTTVNTVLPLGGETREFTYTSELDTAGGVMLVLRIDISNGAAFANWVTEFVLRDVTCIGTAMTPDLDWEEGSISAESLTGEGGGGKASSSTRIRTPHYLHITSRAAIRVAPASGYKYAVRTYSAPTGSDGFAGTLGGYQNWYHGETVQTIDPGTYLRFVLAAEDDATIATSAASNLQVTLYTTEDEVEIKLDDKSTTVSITGEANHRYVGNSEANLVDVTFSPCASGLCELVFTTGSSPVWAAGSGTVMPAWFAIEAGYTYEMNFLDKRGAVMAWPTT